MATLGQNQYYKTNINGQDVYQAVPWGGNIPYGFTPLTQQEYISGLQGQVQQMQDLASKTYQKPNQLGYWYKDKDVQVMGQNPTPEYISQLQKQLSDVQSGTGIHATGWTDPTMKNFLPNAPTPSEQYYKPEYFATLAPGEQQRLKNLYPQQYGNMTIGTIPQGYQQVQIGNTYGLAPTNNMTTNTLANATAGLNSATTPATGSGTSYTVQKGDTLSQIAQRYGVPLSSITGYRSGNPDLIYPGEVLNIGAVKTATPAVSGTSSSSASSNGMNFPQATVNTPNTSDASSFLASMQALIASQQKQADDYKAQYDQMFQAVQSQNKTWLDKITNAPSPAEERLKQYQALGFNPATYFAEAQADIASVKALQEQYNSIDAQKMAAIQAEDNRLASTGVIDRRKATLENQYNLKLYEVSGKINAQSAVMAAKQNNFQLASSLVDQAVSDYTAGLQLQYKNYELFYNSNKDLLDSMDKKYTTALQNTISLTSDAIQMAQDKYYEDLNAQIDMIKASKSSSSSTTVNSYTGLSDKDDAKFWAEVDAGKNELEQGSPWGTVWNRIKLQFPNVSNEVIDNGLGTEWRQPGAYSTYKARNLQTITPQEEADANFTWSLYQMKDRGDTKKQVEADYKSINNVTTIPAKDQEIIDSIFPKSAGSNIVNTLTGIKNFFWQ